MKKIVLIPVFFIIFLLSLSFTIAQDTPPATVTMEKLSWWDRLTESVPFYITGGEVGIEKVDMGDSIDTSLSAKFVLPLSGYCAEVGTTTKDKTTFIEVFFENGNTRERIYLDKFYFTKQYNVNDWIKFTFNNLDTYKIRREVGDDWCGQAIYVAGNHYVCLDGMWAEDKLGGWSRTNDNFLLECPKVLQPCEVKKVGDPFCLYDDTVAQKYQSEYRDDAGNCKITNKIIQHCPAGTRCSDGVCEATKVCESGDTKCKGSALLICKNNEWYYDFVLLGVENSCTTGCVDGKCQSETDEVTISSDYEEQTITCPDGTEILATETCDADQGGSNEIPCVGDVYTTCDDGREVKIFSCVDGMAEITGDSCAPPGELGCVSNLDCGKGYYCKTSEGICYDTFLSQYWWALLIGGIVAILLFVLIRRKK